MATKGFSDKLKVRTNQSPKYQGGGTHVVPSFPLFCPLAHLGRKYSSGNKGCFWGIFKWGPWRQLRVGYVISGLGCWHFFFQMISFSPCVSYEHRIDWSLSQSIQHHFFLFLSSIYNPNSLFHLGSWDDVEQSGRGSGPFTIVHFIFMLLFYLAILNSFEMNFLSALLWPCESKELSY